VLTKKPTVADEAEIARNPRARSAKLRAGERTDAPAHRGEASDFLPRLPSLDDVMRGR
jgi:16S rRNA (cytosine1402-N4)-methyltransferase